MILTISITKSVKLSMVTVMNSRNCLRLLHLDDVGAFVKKDKIIFMIDSRTFNSLKGKRQNN